MEFVKLLTDWFQIKKPNSIKSVRITLFHYFFQNEETGTLSKKKHKTGYS